MESVGDFYAMALHDDQLRAGLVAMHEENLVDRPTRTRAVRSAVAAALRALAMLVDASQPSAPAEGLPGGALRSGSVGA